MVGAVACATADNPPGPGTKQTKPVRSLETRQKIAAARRGRAHSPETRQKISEASRQRKLSLAHRFNIAQAHLGLSHTPETRAKIGATERATKARLKQQRLAARQALLASDEADVAAGSSTSGDVEASAGLSPDALAPTSELTRQLVREKAVIEMMETRLWLAHWMGAYEKEHGYQPTLPETSKSHPEVYSKFVRYVALRELVRQAEKGGPDSYPVLWE